MALSPTHRGRAEARARLHRANEPPQVALRYALQVRALIVTALLAISCDGKSDRPISKQLRHDRTSDR
jgi:hypothetical protein